MSTLRDLLEAEDWTRDPATGRSNSSAEFLGLVTIVERIIRAGAASLIDGHADHVARVVMAQLAHKHGLVPRAALERLGDTGTVE